MIKAADGERAEVIDDAIEAEKRKRLTIDVAGIRRAMVAAMV